MKTVHFTDHRDEYHLYSNSFANRLMIIDPTDNQLPHVDAFQLIPDRSWLRYGLAYGKNILIANNSILSPNSKRNGIAAFDGLFSNITIVGNTIDTLSEHEITLNGVINATFVDNVNQLGEPSKIIVNPWRIGGGLYPDVNVPFIWVIHTTTPLYEPLIVDTTANLKDLRTEPVLGTIGSVTVTDFNKELFASKHPKPNQYTSLVKYITDLRSLALDCSKILT